MLSFHCHGALRLRRNRAPRSRRPDPRTSLPGGAQRSAVDAVPAALWPTRFPGWSLAEEPDGVLVRKGARPGGAGRVSCRSLQPPSLAGWRWLSPAVEVAVADLAARRGTCHLCTPGPGSLAGSRGVAPSIGGVSAGQGPSGFPEAGRVRFRAAQRMLRARPSGSALSRSSVGSFLTFGARVSESRRASEPSPIPAVCAL